MPTVTPADIPKDEPTLLAGFAPGLTRDGVVNPIALGRAHEAVLNETSYTVVTKSTVRYANGTLRAKMTIKSRVVASAERYYSIIELYRPKTASGNNTVQTSKYWSNGERVLVAVSQGNTTTYEHYESPRGRVYGPNFPRGEQFYRLFYAIDTRVVNHTTRNGTTLYRLVATNITQPDQLPYRYIYPYKNPRNFTFHAVIDSRGLVHEYCLAYTVTSTATGQPQTIDIVRSVRYTKIGATTVERPPWYTAANRTSPTTISR